MGHIAALSIKVFHGVGASATNKNQRLEDQFPLGEGMTEGSLQFDMWGSSW